MWGSCPVCRWIVCGVFWVMPPSNLHRLWPWHSLPMSVFSCYSLLVLYGLVLFVSTRWLLWLPYQRPRCLGLLSELESIGCISALRGFGFLRRCAVGYIYCPDWCLGCFSDLNFWMHSISHFSVTCQHHVSAGTSRQRANIQPIVHKRRYSHFELEYTDTFTSQAMLLMVEVQSIYWNKIWVNLFHWFWGVNRFLWQSNGNLCGMLYFFT